MNLTLLDRPMISFDYWSDTQKGFDGLVLQYSTDGGQNWYEVGDATGGGINWYNESDLASSPGDQDNFAWSGSTEQWKTARYNLDEIPVAERDLVVFRFAFASNSDNTKVGPVLEGFAFDNVFIGNKSKNVLIEHFTNTGITQEAKDHFKTIYDNQILAKGASDFNVIQYHMANPSTDQLNANNPVDPFSRAQWYGVPQPKTAIMDGIQGTYFGKELDGTFSLIDQIEIDRRSLEDPLFSIVPTLDMGADVRLTGTVEFKYNGTVDDSSPKILHAVLVEDGVGPDMQNNVVRKLLWGPQGKLITGTLTPGTTLPLIEIDYNMATEVADRTKLWVVIFVQDKNSKVIHHSVIVKAPDRDGVVVGLPEDPDASVFNGLSVYPIPASSTLNVSLDKVLAKDYRYRIIDQRGAEIMSGGLNRDLRDAQSIDISHIRNGIYFLCVQTSDRTVYYRKIAVMNRE
jgi:hypothetical protein